VKKSTLMLLMLFLSACSTTKPVDELPSIPSGATPQEAAGYITATCAGFAKAGVKNGHGTELVIFNSCMNKAIEMLLTTKATGDKDE
jgi:hypothetical protein